MSDVNKRFFEDLLRDRSMSLRQLAKRMDILPSQLSLTFTGKRRMQIAEAVKIAQILGTTINEVMINAGIEEAKLDRQRVRVVGILNGEGEVDTNESTIERTIAPQGLPSDCTAIQARTADSPLAWLDGWVFFCNGRQPPEELIGKFCHVKIADGPAVLATIGRGYSSGTYNLSGPFSRVSQRLEWASPIIATRN